MPACHNKSELSVGYPGDVLGGSNVQRASSHPSDWDTLAHVAGWRATLDGSGQWLSWDANNWQRTAFRLSFAPHRPRRLVLQTDGSLQAQDEAGAVVWQRGPFGEGSRWEDDGGEGWRRGAAQCTRGASVVSHGRLHHCRAKD